MPILFVNGERSGVRARGRARVGSVKRKVSDAIKSAVRRRRLADAGVVRKRKASRRTGSVKRRVSGAIRSAVRRRRAADTEQRRARRKKGRSPMARKKRQPAGLRRYWASRKRAGKAGRPGKTRRRRRKAALAAPKRRRGKRKAVHKTRRRRRKAASAAPKRRRGKRKAVHKTRRRTRRRKSGARHRRKSSHRTRRRSRRAAVVVLGPGGKTIRATRGSTLKLNPGRRRRRHRRNPGRRRRHRRNTGRLRRRYRRNPGGMLMDLAKRAVPVLLSLYGSRLLVSKLGPMIPGVSALGTFQGPALAIGAVGLVHLVTKKVGSLAKYRNEALLGATLSAIDSLIGAFAPASVKSMIGVGDIYDRGMSDYVAVGDYVQMGATPIDDDIAMSDYIAVGSDGVMEELGMGALEELGAEEELGNDLLGGMPGGASLMKQIPGRQFLSPIPARSFSREIPAAGGNYDNPGLLYNGIFKGSF